MKEIKPYILEFIWSGKSVSQFEQWLYEQDSVKFEKLIGEINYTELVSFDYEKKTVELIKEFIKTILPQNLIYEFESEFDKRKSKVIRGKCLKNEALDYYEKKTRNWEVEIGKEYEFLIVNSGIQNGNHNQLVNYVDRTNHFQPSGFVPMELFEIDLANLSEFYHKVITPENELTIELIAFSKSNYSPSQYSFWEDFYADDEKAVTKHPCSIYAKR
jgi:hypothetical protein